MWQIYDELIELVPPDVVVDECLVGLHWTLVRAGGAVGMAMTMREGAEHLDLAGRMRGMPLRRVACRRWAMRPFADLLAEAEVMHGGHACPGQVLGVRMAMAACRALGIDEPTVGKRLIVFVEIDRCAADAIAAVTGCRLGRRTLKYVDYGKMAATFLDTRTQRAVRVIALESSRTAAARYAPPGLGKYDAQREAYKVMPDHELLKVQEVEVELRDEDRPGPPISQVLCDRCGEGINDRREVRRNGQVLCAACAGQGYYRVLHARV